MILCIAINFNIWDNLTIVLFFLLFSRLLKDNLNNRPSLLNQIPEMITERLFQVFYLPWILLAIFSLFSFTNYSCSS